MSKALRVLCVEDSENDVLLLLQELRKGGYDSYWERVETPGAMSAAVEESSWDLVLSDFLMPRFSALAALNLIQQTRLDLPFIVVSGVIGEEQAVAMMKAGAHDYVLKSNLTRLPAAIERELKEAAVRRRRKRAEEELQRTATELARSNAELAQFAFLASHDLQEPLRKIQVFGGRLATKFGDALGDDGKDYLQQMQNASVRMQTLINDLLTLSLVTSKADPFLPVDLARVVREVLADLEIRIEEAGAHVNVGALPTIDADPTQMRQLLQYLIVNALKFRRDSVAPEVKLYARSLNSRQHQTINSLDGERC